MAKSTIDSIMKVADVVDTLDRKGKTFIVHRIQRQLAEKPRPVTGTRKKKVQLTGEGQGT